MLRHLRHNDTNMSDNYIGHWISISDIRYLFPMSDIPSPSPNLTSDIDIRMSDVGTWMSDIGSWMLDIISKVQYLY